MSAATYSISELAILGGVSRRTVRYYIQRELLPAPLGLGRGKHYSPEHLELLIAIRDQQQQGANLDDIAASLRSAESACAAVAKQSEKVPWPVKQQAWLRVLVQPGVELHLERATGFDGQALAAIAAAVGDAIEALNNKGTT